MTDNPSSTPELQRIAAFADGELDGEDNLHVLEQSQTDSQVASKIRHQQQLRRACQRAMRDPCDCPCELKERLRALCCEASQEAGGPPILARIGRWAPALVAAVLLLGAVMLYRDGFTGPPRLDATILPIAQAERFNNRHDTCSHSLEALYNAHKYPGSLTALPQAVAEKLGQPVPALDLTALGYRFEGAGDCRLPGTESVHLVYKAAPDSGHADSVSLWVCADDGSLPIAQGRIFSRECPRTDRKLLVWRHAGIVYYLLGDEPARTQAIAESLRHIS